MKSVTLETKCWEKDWKKILNSDWLVELTRRNAFEFNSRILFINNVKKKDFVCKAAELAIKRGAIDSFYLVEDYAEKALKHFGIEKESLGRGYVYSISELVSIYLCQSDYLLHYAGDCIPYQTYRWIPLAIELMETDKRIKSASLTWNGDYQGAKNQSLDQNKLFWFDHFFSDQNYLVKSKDFFNGDFRTTDPICDVYPEYGGELFEKRVASWYWKNGFYRATFKHGAYHHQIKCPSFSDKIFGRAKRLYNSIIGSNK